MSRGVWAAIAGYITLVIMVFGLFSLCFAVLGADGAFQPASFDVTATWIGVGIAVNLVAALIAGIVTIAFRGNRGSLVFLSTMVLIMGVLIAVKSLNAPDDPKGTLRTAPVTNFEAMMRARQPFWVAIVNPLVAVAGLVAGAALRRRPS
jgi:hypothetical protein